MATRLQEVLARNLKTCRKIQGISQAKLAELIGVSIPFIGEIEIGRKYPSLETLEKLAGALQVEPYELLIDEFKPSRYLNVGFSQEVVSEIAHAVESVLLTHQIK